MILLNQQEDWQDKYRRFLKEANENCIRIDADIIPNRNIQKITTYQNSNQLLLVQFRTYCLYKNDLTEGIMFYSREILNLARSFNYSLDRDRPETSFWRLKEIQPYTQTDQMICGIHGFYQDNETMDRALRNKIIRGQQDLYDFELLRRIRESFH